LAVVLFRRGKETPINRARAGGGRRAGKKDFQEDLKTRDMFDQMPSLDPFLLREGLRP